MAVVNQQTMHIAFDGHQVAVHSDAPQVLAGLRRSFQEMLEPESNGPVGQLEVWQKNGKYQLRGNRETQVGDGSLADILRCLRYEVALYLIEARPDLLWLHAGAVAYQGNVVMISGLSGRGKSTLVTSLYAHGWAYLSDDIIPLDPNSDRVIPFPQTPMIRENLGREIPRHRLRELRKTEVTLKPEMVCREAMPVRALIFPSYSARSSTRLLPCSPATAALELLENSLNFVNHREAAVGHLCDLVKRVPAFQLPFNNGKLVAELVTQAYDNGQLFEYAISKPV